MPVHRRRTPVTQIAKVNARSVEGYFGEGTPCFFIRGTILADHQVDGEYRTLAIHRPGNLIAIEAFDGEWALVAITSRSGDRAGDNIFARLWLRDDDLKAVRIDCEGILAGVDAVALPELEAASPDWAGLDTAPRPAIGLPSSPDAPPSRPDPPPSRPALEPAAAPAGTPNRRARLVRNAAGAAATAVKNAFASLRDGKIFVEVGASVGAIALPVVLYVLRAYFSRRND